MELVFIASAALLAAILTFFSGFGLGTILTPVFMIFFPTDLAIALTGVVHFFNNIFKLSLVGKNANRPVVLQFGIPAVIMSLLGAWLMLQMVDLPMIHSYQFNGKEFTISPIKLTIAVLLIFFALMDLVPGLKKIQFGRDKLVLGGVLSGFFGGLSGNQGALRSAFLVKAGLSKEAFIGTAVVVSILVDFSRLGVYATKFSRSGLVDNIQVVLVATLSAFLGAYIGNKLLKKLTLHFIQVTVAVMLLILSILLGAGLL
jgi:uncharacterized membrane protein YfcA